MTDKDHTRTTGNGLHPVYTVTDITRKIRILDGTKVTYSCWTKLFLLHAKAYRVLQHIDGTAPPKTDDSTFALWEEIDSAVLQWIYCTVSDDLLARILKTPSTAHAAWTRLAGIFLNNKGSRAAALEQEFNNLTLKALPTLEAYCQRLKDLSDQLADVDCPVTDNRLVLQLVRGLPAEFDNVGSLINQSLPAWEVACSMLQLELQRQKARDSHLSPVVMAVTATPDAEASANFTARRPSATSGQCNSGQRSASNQRRNGPPNTNGNPKQGRGAPRAPAPFWPYPPQWPGWYPPPCPYPTQPGWTYTPPPQPQYTTPPRGSFTSTQPSNPFSDPNATEAHLSYDALEPTQIQEAFNAMTMNPPDETWYMDTGATSHLSADQEWATFDSPQ